MFIDQARIFVKAGSGGNGCNSLYRDKYIRRGRPDGGDGGNGGTVIIKADKGIQTLLDFHNKRGRRGEDFVILVPCGTIVKDVSTNLILRDLLESDDSVIIAKGGKGGKGNSRGRVAASGEKGEEKDLVLELKLIADIGIIGYPNVGKSTFISKISSAKSKIADYPFTTKRPILGMVRHYEDRTLTFADMPGLIEGAHRGRGLGDRFLRHIERTRLLLHMIDISLLERKDPYKDFTLLNEELKLYSKNLVQKKQIIVLNKIDLPGPKNNVGMIKDRVGQEVFPISALTGEGVKELLDHIFQVA